MEDCEYKPVSTRTLSDSSSEGFSRWRPFLRQLMVCSSVWTAKFLYGLSVGAPTVFIPQIRRETNSSIVTDSMASWISSVSGFSASFFIILLSIGLKFIGRRTYCIIGVFVYISALILLYFSTNVIQILISSVMQGFFIAIELLVAITIITEYTSPKYRGFFLTINAVGMYWGIWTSNAIGTFFHWKIIPLLGIAGAIYCLSIALIVPESPYWLNSRGRFGECAASHRWLKGCDEESEKELEALIKLQKEYMAGYDDVKLTVKERILDFFRTVKSKAFYKPVALAAVAVLLIIFSGKMVCTVYAIDIIKKITNSEPTAYTAMLILDGITICSMYVGCILARFIKRRTLLLTGSCIGAALLFLMSLYLYLIKLSVIVENVYISILLLSLICIAVSTGPLLMSATVYGELIPIRSRNLAICTISLIGKFMMALALKTAPLLFKAFDLHGVFLAFGVSSWMIIIILYMYLPETKDKTLQEIGENIQGKKQNKLLKS